MTPLLRTQMELSCQPSGFAKCPNFLSAGHDETAEIWLADPVRWERFLEWELAAEDRS